MRNVLQNIVILAVLFFTQQVFAQCDEGANVWNDSWTSCNPSQSPNSIRGNSHWLLYEFTNAEEIGLTHIWNANRVGESQLGAKDVIIDYSSDGENWIELGNFTFPQADESLTYDGFDGPSFEGETVKKVLITFLTNHKETNVNCISIAEIQFELYGPDFCTSKLPERPQLIEAECFADMAGIRTEQSSEGTENIGFINNAEWSFYDNIDLTGMKSIDVRVASATNGGDIEVRTGSVTGPLLAIVPVANTGGWQIWETRSVNLDTELDGNQDIYLVFTGANGSLFNINWFGFSEEEIIVTGIENDFQRHHVNFYPNPAKDVINIEGFEGGRYELFGNNGVIYSSGDINTDKETVNLDNLNSGIYFIKLIKDETAIVDKLTIE